MTTSRKTDRQAEKTLEETESLLHAIFEKSRFLIALKNVDGRYRMTNRAVLESIGRVDEGVLGKTAYDLFPKETADTIRAHDQAAMRGTSVFEAELAVDTVDGPRIISQSKFPILDPDGRVAGVGVIGADITERVQATEALRKSEERFALAVRGADDGIWDWDIQTGEDYFSDRWLELLGYESGDFPRNVESWQSLVHPDDRDRVMEAVDRHLEKREPYNVGMRLRTKSGNYRSFQARGQAVWDENGKPLRMAGSISDITERLEADQALKESEGRFKNFAESTSDWFWEMDAELRYTDYTAPEEMTGRPPNTAIGKTRWEFLGIDPDTDGKWRDHKAVLDARKPFRDFQYAVIGPTGITYWWSISGVPILGDGGVFQGYRGSATDITEARRVQESVRESEARLNAIIENAPLMIVLKDTEGRYLVANRYYEEQYGLRAEDVIGSRVHDLLPPEVADIFDADDKEVLETGEAILNEVPTITVDGKRVFQQVKFPIKNEFGKIFGIGFFALDMTERKRAEEEISKLNEELENRVEERTAELTDEIVERKHAEEALKDSESRLRLITNNLPVLISYVDKNVRWRFNNDAYRDWFGLDPAKLAGRHLRDELGEEAYETVRGYIEQVLAGKPVFYEAAVPFKHKGTRFIQANYVPHFGAEKEVLGFFVSITDITAQKKAEDTLKKREQEFRVLAECSNDWFWQTDANGRFLYYSEPGGNESKLFSNVAGMSLSELFEKRNSDNDHEKLAAAVAEQKDFRNLTCQISDDAGAVKWIRISGSPRFSDDGRFVGFLGSSTDTTAQHTKKLYEQQRQKLEGLGSLAGGIAHELNNLLQPILSLNQLELEKAKPGSRSEFRLKHSMEAGVRARDIVRNVLRFSRKSDHIREPLIFSKEVESALELCRAGLPATIKINASIPDLDDRALLGRSDITQILTNLLSNSSDAMGQKGEIGVYLSKANVKTSKAESLGVKPGRHFLVRIEDTGYGIDDSIRDRIFEPFFTTKEVGEGTGLGLSAAYGIVSNLGGTIDVKSNVGKGTTFDIFVPCA